MHKCDYCGVNPVADEADYCSTCNAILDSILDAAVEDISHPTVYRKKFTSDTLLAYAVEESAAMNNITVLCCDRFRKVGPHHYRLMESISTATYLIPDRLLITV